MENSLREKPERHAPRRLSDHLVLEGRKQKVHSLVDKVYSRKNLKLDRGLPPPSCRSCSAHQKKPRRRGARSCLVTAL